MGDAAMAGPRGTTASHARYKKLQLAAIGAVSAGALAQHALAINRTWVSSTGGSWAAASNWSPAHAPNTSDTAIFDLGSAAGYTVAAPSSNSSGDLYVYNDNVQLNL